MATTLYATLDELKTRLQISLTDTTQDAALTDVLTAACRQVDEDCGRRFYLDAAASARVLNPYGRTACTSRGYELLVDDIGSTAELIVETGSGSSYTAITDYETFPDNAITLGRPVTSLLGVWQPWAFTRQDRVRVTAVWGWPSVPSQIKQATLIEAQRLSRRKDSPEGVAGFNDLGVVRLARYDPDYDRLISSYKLPGFG